MAKVPSATDGSRPEVTGDSVLPVVVMQLDATCMTMGRHHRRRCCCCCCLGDNVYHDVSMTQRRTVESKA